MPAVPAPAPISSTDIGAVRKLEDAIGTVVRGKPEAIRASVIALLSRGHLLIEDIPGVGKTTLARALAAALGGTFRRIQFTSDLLPSDIVGVSIYDQHGKVFELKKGPIFANVVLADEINRAPPRTQSGLLQAMQEGRVTLDDRTFALPSPFLVMATQNPLEHHGTYPLPESQLDRFLMRLTIGYPGQEAERRILLESATTEPMLEALQPVLTPAQVIQLQNDVESVRADDAIVDHLMEIVRRTRTAVGFRMGVSPRGAIALFRAARAYALTSGRRFLVPDDVRRLVVPCLAHRLLPAGATAATLDAHDQAAGLLERIMEEVEVPV
jgi:MoxR-like ATPase